MIRCLLVVSLVALSLPSASAETLQKSYSYFSVGGTTLEQLDDELQRRGPRVKTTGQRHPGATQMQFRTKLGYVEKDGRCRITEANVAVEAKVILPRWRQRARADQDTRLVWDALSGDIKRHEDQHVKIARDYARQLERRLLRLGRHKDCQAAAARAKATVDQVLAKHEQAQAKFDQVESRNFEKRLLRLMKQRARMIQSGEVSG